MAVYNAWTVEYKNGSTWTAISNVQDLNCSVGRQTAVDQWPVSQASIRIWFPTGYATPIANLTVGTYIRFFAPGRSSTKPSWTGLVRNMTLEVGIPWNSGTSTGNGDFLMIDCEGHYADVGRMAEYGTTASVAALSPGSAQRLVAYLQVANIGIRAEATTTAPYETKLFFWVGDPSSPSNFFFRSIGPLVTEFLALTNFRLCDGVRKTSGASTDAPMIFIGPPAAASTVTSVGFSDTTNNSTNRQFDEITFDGLADQYYTQATLSYTVGGTATEMTSSTGSAPYRTYYTQPPASTAVSPYYLEENYRNQAEYLANAFTPPDIGLAAISATTNGQHTQNLDTLGVADLELGYLPLYVVPVTLRGQTFYCQIEGVQVTADTNSARFTYYVTPTDTTAWFILDDSNFGVLDQNRLGIY